MIFLFRQYFAEKYWDLKYDSLALKNPTVLYLSPWSGNHNFIYLCMYWKPMPLQIINFILSIFEVFSISIEAVKTWLKMLRMKKNTFVYVLFSTTF